MHRSETEMEFFASKRNKIILVVVGLLVLIIGGFYIYRLAVEKEIELEIGKSGEGEAEFGVPFDLEVRLVNHRATTLRGARVAIYLPEDLFLVDTPEERTVTREIGDIAPGEMHRESFKVVVAPAEESRYETRATLSYSPSGLAATFKKEAGFELALRRPEFEIRIEAPESVYRGEEFEANISLQTEGARAFEGWQFRLDYPSGFSLLDSNPPPTIDTNGWPLDKLEGEGGRLTIRGKADLDEGSVFALAGRMAMPLFGKEHTLLKTEKLISLNSSPLSLDLKLSEPKEAVGRAEKLVYIISFRNNTDTPLKSVIVRASLTGEMFDYDSLASEAKFERKNNVLFWEPSRFNQLEELEPGESGEFNFSIGTKDDYSIQKLSDKNFSLQVRAEIESPTVPYHIAVSKTLNSKILETKVRGEIKAEARAYFRDAGSFIINQGPLPPKVGASTNFTIHWLLTNFTTDLAGVEVRARLEDGVTFTGKAKSNVQSLPEFDEKSGEVIWRPGNISATLGVLGEKPEAIFQVEAIPKSSRTGQYLPLIGETKVSARDEWSGLEITASAGSVDTRLPGDPTVKEGEGLVRP